MSKRPAFQYYPGDFKRDTALQSCGFYARSVWREMMDLMHDGEPYGHLTANGEQITAAELSRIVGEPVRKVSAAIDELERKKIFSRTDCGVIFSRRMVRDEELRAKRGAGGRLSLNHPDVPKPKDRSKDTTKDTLRPSLGGSPASAYSSAPSSAFEIIDWAEVEKMDVENFVSLAMQTANGGMIAAGIEFNPIMGNHRSRQNVFDWLEAGVSRQTILETVQSAAKAAGKQISSMKYFTNAVTNAHEKGKAVVIPEGSQAAEVAKKGVAANYPQSNQPRHGDPLAERDAADKKRVDAWQAEHKEEAKKLWESVRDELQGKGMDGLGGLNFQNLVDANYRRRVVTEILTPKALAS